jgi:hypothetical protein
MGRELTPTRPDLIAYRTAVDDVLVELTGRDSAGDLPVLEKILTERITEPELAAVLGATNRGITGSVQNLMFEARQYRAVLGSSDADLLALVRNYLYSQVDVMWWEQTDSYSTDADVWRSSELVNLDGLRRRGRLGFGYRRQARTLPVRVARAAERRIWPDGKPHTAGLRFARARPAAVGLLNGLAADFARAAPPGTPPLFVTSLARSVEHQHRLRALGYPAVLPSAHCVGYAVDIEMSWFRHFSADRVLAHLLRQRQERGDANVIDEGQVWHVCVNPAAVDRLRRDFDSGR